MKKKVEFKKTIIISCIVIIAISIVFECCLFYQYKVYTNNFNKKIEMIVANVQNQYPDIDKNELIGILNDEKHVETGFFEKYGINLETDSAILENDKMFVKFSVINLCFSIGLAIIVLLIFVKYNNSKDKKLKEITNYIEEINNKNYKLDIEDNTEDELSILKNEVYKTTVMLNEVAENSVNDKKSLKNSLSDISHQLKTPLTSMSVMIDNIVDNPEMDSETRVDFIKDIKREIININFLVNSLLKLSKLDVDSVHFIREQVSIKDIIDEAIKNVSVLCDLKNINILVSGNANVKIFCDFKWQVEAITNVIKNCVEHSEVNSKLEISYGENNIYSEIKIRDYGSGIDKQDLPHIFERFYKGKNSSSESVGIGLALAKSIIDSNNGYISVESQVGNGSLFIIKYFKFMK